MSLVDLSIITLISSDRQEDSPDESLDLKCLSTIDHMNRCGLPNVSLSAIEVIVTPGMRKISITPEDASLSAGHLNSSLDGYD